MKLSPLIPATAEEIQFVDPVSFNEAKNTSTVPSPANNDTG